ncbi:tetratricopeptide repeat protein [Lentzea alba]|uniref:ATP-binding protein n=1 Tax=Lentzea alba TaxID=2714351 RepID=UPI0039BF96C1
MRVQLLGHLTVEGVSLTDRQRRLLAALLLEPGRAVPQSRLLSAIWDDDLPTGPEVALRTQVFRLRKALKDVPELAVTTVGQTYSIEVDPHLVDLHRFRRLVAEARTLPDPALLESALELWQDDALRDLPGTPLWNGVRAALGYERRAVQDEFDAAGKTVAAPAQVPHQLPAAIPGFTGRDDQLRELADRSGTVLITAIDGIAGVGKTALALHFGHSEVARFPDGRLYVNLRGFDPQDRPLAPSDVLTQFLRALGVKAQHVPLGEAEQSKLYRSLMADRRMLVLLDNAAHADQVRPLLPGGSSTCLITSRNRLVDLDAVPLFLDVMTEQEAVALLRRVLGDDIDLAAARELARLCGYLPLALRIAAANAGEFLADTVADLREQNRLAALVIDDDEQAAVRAAFDLSYLALDDEHRTLFRRLGLLAGLDFTAESAAALAEGSLDVLHAANLVEQPQPGRYRLHDLLRLYAFGRAQTDDSAQAREQALDRLHRWYLDATYTAALSIAPEKMLLERGTEVPLPSSAADWLDNERANVVAVAAQAPGRVRYLLLDRMHTYLKIGRHTAEQVAMAESALETATAANDEQGLQVGHLGIAAGHASSGRLRQAADILTESLRTAWPEARVRLLHVLGDVLREEGDVDRALACYTESSELTAAIGLDDMLASQYFSLGTTCWMQNRLEESLRYLMKAHELAAAHGRHYYSMFYLAVCGGTLRDLGRYEEAADNLSRFIVEAREQNMTAHLSSALSDLATVHTAMGEHELAAQHGEEALTLARDMGDPAFEADVRVALGALAVRRGQPEAAAEHLDRAVAAAREAGYRHAEAAALIARRTVPDVLQGLTIARTSGYRLLEHKALKVLAEIHPDHEFYARQAAQIG